MDQLITLVPGSLLSCVLHLLTIHLNFFDLTFNLNSLKSLFTQLPPLPDQQKISTEHFQTDLILDQLLQIQHLSPLTGWQHVVQDLGGEKNENAINDIRHSPMQ